MARQRKALQTLKEKDVPNANIHGIKTNDNSEATTDTSTGKHAGGSTNEPSGSSEPQDNEPRRSERIVDAKKRAALAAKTHTAAAKAAPKSKPPPKAKPQPKEQLAVSKARPIKPVPKPKVTPKPKPEAKKPVAGPSQSVRRNLNKTVPTPEEIASTYETRLLASGLRRLQDVVACFQERLGELHEGVVKMADTPVNTLPGSIAHENMFQDFRAGLDELEGYFPTVVQELVCSAKMVLSVSRGKRHNDTSMGDKRQEAAEKTTIEPFIKKRLREKDTNGAENDVRHHPRRRLVPPVAQNRSGQGISSPSTSNADPRGVLESEEHHSEQLPKEKDRKGKGKETILDSNLEQTSNDPDDLLATEGVLQTIAIEDAASGSASTPQPGHDTHQAPEDAVEDNIDGEGMIRSESVVWRTSSCRSDLV